MNDAQPAAVAGGFRGSAHRSRCCPLTAPEPLQQGASSPPCLLHLYHCSCSLYLVHPHTYLACSSPTPSASLTCCVPQTHPAATAASPQVRDRAMLHLTQLQGGAGGAEAISTDLDINLAAFEASLRNYLDGDDTQQAFDVVS